MQIIYITFPSEDEAVKLSNTLVAEELVACANIFSPITSIYKWEGEVKNDKEVVVIAKTVDKLVDKVVDRIKGLHSYDCPCVISIKIDGGNKDFLKWVENSVKLPY